MSDVETESDAVYSESRASALRKRVQSGNGPSNGTNISKLVGQNPRTKSSAKSDKRSGKPSDGEFLNSAPLATVVRGDSREDDMTRELFSSGDEEEMGDEGGCEGVSTPLPPTPLTGAKKSNPFKVCYFYHYITMTSLLITSLLIYIIMNYIIIDYIIIDYITIDYITID